jgi:hypothetical protein
MGERPRVFPQTGCFLSVLLPFLFFDRALGVGENFFGGKLKAIS